MSLHSVPELHFDYMAPRTWKRDGLTLGQIAAELDRLRRAAKSAVDYQWDNTHFVIDSLYGRPAVHFTVDPSCVSLWEANHGRYLGTFPDFPADLEVWINRHIAENSEVLCGECGKWVHRNKWIAFSFAGAVCQACYDPKKHLPPDSR